MRSAYDAIRKPTGPHRVGASVTAITQPSANQSRGHALASHTTSSSGSSKTSAQRSSSGTTSWAGTQYGATGLPGRTRRVSGAVQVPRVYW